jgi:hypothetical protein
LAVEAWALFPLATVDFSIEDTQPGTLDHLATLVVYWLMAVLPLLLLLVGLVDKLLRPSAVPITSA